MTFGVYPRVSLAKARSLHGQAREMLEDKGRDPGTELVDAKRARRDAATVNDLADEYIEKWAKPRKRSWQEDRRLLKANVRPAIGHKKAADVRRRDIIEILDAIVDRGAPISANRTLAVVRKMFRFGLTRDLVPHNPCEAVQAPARENQRDRVLNAVEIKTIWKKLEGGDLDMTPAVGLCLQLMLATAQRRREVVTAKWADIDLSAGWWVVPETVAKNKLPHRVPLSALSIRLLKAAKMEAGSSSYVFPNPSDTAPIRDDAISKAVRRNEAKFKVPHFTPHDLRRTAASQMASAGTSRLTISKILNHVESGITAVYDRHGYDAEKRKALNAWGRKLERIIKGKSAKVVQLKAG